MIDIHNELSSAQSQQISPTQPITATSSPTLSYLYLLSHLSKSLIKQAENEVNAHPESAYPLAKIVLGLCLSGHCLLGEVLMARLVKKCCWVVPYYPAKEPVSQASG